MNALVAMPVRAAPCAAGAFEAALVELFTVHDTRAEAVALIHDAALPWVVRRGGPLPTIYDERFRERHEAEATAAILAAIEPEEPMNTLPNRRGLFLGAITAGAAASVGPLPAIAGVERHDPTLPLVEAHKAAWAKFVEATDVDEPDHERCEAAGRAVDAALAALLATPPATPAGARATIAWLVEFDQGRAPETSGAYLATLLRSPVLAA